MVWQKVDVERHILPNTATATTTMMIAIIPPVLKSYDELSPPEAPASTSILSAPDEVYSVGISSVPVIGTEAVVEIAWAFGDEDHESPVALATDGLESVDDSACDTERVACVGAADGSEEG